MLNKINHDDYDWNWFPTDIVNDLKHNKYICIANTQDIHLLLEAIIIKFTEVQSRSLQMTESGRWMSRDHKRGYLRIVYFGRVKKIGVYWGTVVSGLFLEKTEFFARLPYYLAACEMVASENKVVK